MERNTHEKRIVRWIVETFYTPKMKKQRAVRLVLNSGKRGNALRSKNRCYHPRWKTATKINGVRVLVACRICGFIQEA